MKEGQKILLYPHLIQFVYGSTYHYSSEVFFSSPSSNVVAKGSPIKVQ